MNSRHCAIGALVATLITAGCGGGGGGSDAPEAPVAGAPVISVQPAPASVITDATATFAVTATGGGLTYQWRKNGVVIPGATTATYTTPAVRFADDAQQYSVVVSNTLGSVTSSTAPLKLALSDNQKIFESLTVSPAGGSHGLQWNLPNSGTQVTDKNYLSSDYSLLAASPLALGPQISKQSPRLSLIPSLAVFSATPTRILKEGKILVIPPSANSSRISYVGPDIKVESMSSDGTTVGLTQRRSDFSTVNLTGVLSSTPPEMAHWFNAVFANPAVLSATATYGSGAAYIKYKATNVGDRYDALDCVNPTTDAAVDPCLTGTLTNALAAGLFSKTDAKTYQLADGVIRTVNGVSVWVANTPRPTSSSSVLTEQYTTYFELDGKVYTGALIKDGTTLNGGYHVSNPAAPTFSERVTVLPYQIRFNKAARDGIAAGVNL